VSRSIEPGLGSDEVQEAVREGEDRYHHLFNELNDAVFVAEVETGVIIEANQQAEVLLGKGFDEIIGMHQSELHPPDKAEQYQAMFAAHIEKGRAADSDAQVVRKDGTIVPVSISASTLTLHGKRFVMGLFRDMTEPKRVEEALREERDRAQKYLDVAGVMLAVVDADEQISLMNNKGCEVLGYSEREVIGQNWFNLLVPERCREEVRGIFRQLMAGQIGPVEYYENALLTKNGAERIMAFHNTVLTDEDGSICAALCSGEDITERKEAERQLRIYQQRLRALAARLSSVEERERRAIAAGLHDDISQALALCKMKMAGLDESSSPSDVASTSGEVRGLLDEAINRTRSLTFQLSPPVLYELGFVPAIEWLAEQLEEEHGVVFSIQQYSQPPLIDDEVGIVLFRAVRELLINVVKHAQTNTARVCIDGNGDQVRVVVQDAGVGFDMAQLDSPGHPPGFGLFDVRERLDYIGGSLQIESQPGAGTRVAMIVPLKLPEQAATDKE